MPGRYTGTRLAAPRTLEIERASARPLPLGAGSATQRAGRREGGAGRRPIGNHVIWCPGRDSNSHAVRRQPLKLVCRLDSPLRIWFYSEILVPVGSQRNDLGGVRVGTIVDTECTSISTVQSA